MGEKKGPRKDRETSHNVVGHNTHEGESSVELMATERKAGSGVSVFQILRGDRSDLARSPTPNLVLRVWQDVTWDTQCSSPCPLHGPLRILISELCDFWRKNLPHAQRDGWPGVFFWKELDLENRQVRTGWSWPE